MTGTEERILELEEEIRRTPYNKATQHHIGRLKARVARLKEEARTRSASKAGAEGYSHRKAGDATAVIVGFPSVGKSTLLNKLTNSTSKVGDYDFTTLKVIPGIMEHRGARIQIFDVPGLLQGASSGRGRGKEVLSVVRSADLILLLADVFNTSQLGVLEQELYDAGIRLNQKPPDVKIDKKERGGLNITATVELTQLNERTVKEVLSEYRIHSADVVIREDLTMERLIDAVAGSRIYLPALQVLNKVDLVKKDYLEEATKKLPGCIAISADKGYSLQELINSIYDKLEFIRVFTKKHGEKADLDEPLILVKGSTVADACERLHKDFREKFGHARVWGTSAKYRGQRVGLEHQLMDGDVISVSFRRQHD